MKQILRWGAKAVYPKLEPFIVFGIFASEDTSLEEVEKALNDKIIKFLPEGYLIGEIFQDINWFAKLEG